MSIYDYSDYNKSTKNAMDLANQKTDKASQVVSGITSAVSNAAKIYGDAKQRPLVRQQGATPYIAPVKEETNVAGTIIGRTAEGAAAGTVVNAGWGTLIGGVLGLVEGIFEGVSGAAGASKDYINAMNKFRDQMQVYYSALNANKKKRVRLEKEQKKDKSRILRETDRANKIQGAIRSINARNSARMDIARRYA